MPLGGLLILFDVRDLRGEKPNIRRRFAVSTANLTTNGFCCQPCAPHKDIIFFGDFDFYADIQKSFILNGTITFAMLSPKKHSLDFYNEALKTDSKQVEDTFLEYTSDKDLWNDVIILWLINNGAYVWNLYHMILVQLLVFAMIVMQNLKENSIKNNAKLIGSTYIKRT